MADSIRRATSPRRERLGQAAAALGRHAQVELLASQHLLPEETDAGQLLVHAAIGQLPLDDQVV